MRISITYNLRNSNAEDSAAFTPADVIAALVTRMEDLGHEVETVETTRRIDGLISDIQKYQPDLIFNLSEGIIGPWRQSLYPAVFEDLNIPYTASDPHSMAIALDKHRTKLLLRNVGIPTPPWQYVQSCKELDEDHLTFPVIVKPNFEASSKGITDLSVATTTSEVAAAIDHLLSRYPQGVLVEKFIQGRDVTVPFLEAVNNDESGILEPAEISVVDVSESHQNNSILGYALKNPCKAETSQTASLQLPAVLSNDVRSRIRRYASTAVTTVGSRDLARVDFRVAADGTPYFLELNSLPSIGPTSTLPKAAALAGLDPKNGFLQAILASASARYGLSNQL